MAEASPRTGVEVARRAWVEQIMGMPISLHLRGAQLDGAVVLAAVAEVFADLRAVDERFSTWKPGSQISRLGRGELTLADCHQDVRAVAELCTEARERTQGWFDAQARRGVDAGHPAGGPAFDPTGLVKGWAVQRATDRLARLTGHDFMINAGGDVLVGCRRTDTPAWTLAIEDPADRSQLLATLQVRTGALATSGSAARGAHIVDPMTGHAATGLLSVSVFGPSLLWADVYATAAFARGPGEATRAWLSGLADHVAYLVEPDGTTTAITGR